MVSINVWTYKWKRTRNKETLVFVGMSEKRLQGEGYKRAKRGPHDALTRVPKKGAIALVFPSNQKLVPLWRGYVLVSTITVSSLRTPARASEWGKGRILKRLCRIWRNEMPKRYIKSHYIWRLQRARLDQEDVIGFCQIEDQSQGGDKITDNLNLWQHWCPSCIGFSYINWNTSGLQL